MDGKQQVVLASTHFAPGGLQAVATQRPLVVLPLELAQYPEQHAVLVVHVAPVAPHALPESGGVTQHELSGCPQLSVQFAPHPAFVQHVPAVLHSWPLEQPHICDTPHESVTETLH
jgi:hypothetical protein